MDFFTRAKSNTHLNSLDGIRALSIIFVILFHVYFFGLLASDNQAMLIAFSDALPFGMSWIRRGDLGVDIFFVLSAFLISSSLFAEELSAGTIQLKKFYLKRFFRIYPIYMVALLIFSLLSGWSIWSLANIFFLNNMTGLEKCIMPWSWSLASEIQFYVSFPLILLFFRRPMTRLLLCIITLVGSFFWLGYWYYGNPLIFSQSLVEMIVDPDKDSFMFFMDYLYTFPLARMPGFIFGIFAGWIWVHKRQCLISCVNANRRRIFLVNVVLVIGCLLMASQNPVLPDENAGQSWEFCYDMNMIFGRSLFTLMACLIMLISIVPREKPDFIRKFLAHKFFYPVSRGSYAMYLFHPGVLLAIYYSLHGTQKLDQLTLSGVVFFSIAGVLGSFIVSIMCYYAVEKWSSYHFLFRSRIKQNPPINPID